jgi:DNA mismatch repair protein MutL
MSKIRVLPEALANKIAAGEVVERPSSVVKELLENALDAGARKIDIEIEAGGKRLIRVVDDGEGMTRDDAITAFERHATSKLKTTEDLEAILTLGFRGEALPSIASVSRLFLRTRTGKAVEGTEIEFNGGRLAAVRDIAWPGGTEVEVKDLFLNVPARRKFLKSDGTESVHITNLVQHYALANPPAGFMLIRDGREVIRVTPAASLRERAYQILGGGLLEKLNEVDYSSEGLRIYGFVSNPQEQRSSRDAQYLFVNRRFVRDQLIGRGLAEAYRSMMPSGAYPAAILFLELPPSDVDVNVHPAKTEVRFLHEAAVLGGVREAVARALQASQPVTKVPLPLGHTPVGHIPVGRPSVAQTPVSQARGAVHQDSGGQADSGGSRNPESPGAVVTASPSTAGQMISDTDEFALTPADEAGGREQQQPLGLNFSQPPGTKPTPSLSADTLTDALNGLSKVLGGPHARGDSSGTCDEPGGLASAPDSIAGARALPGFGHGIKPLGQIRDSYIVATDEEGLLLIDQHVAHERVLFEQFRNTAGVSSSDVQPLLIPETLDLSPAEAEAFELVQAELETKGIEAMRLSGRTVAIKTAPSGLASSDAVAIVRDLLAVVERERRGLNLERVREQIAASVACKAAIKINMPLTPEKMQWLIDELMKTENPMTCPHGRPILMRYGLRDIERTFKRPV